MREIKIEVLEDLSLYIADITCWIEGFIIGREDEHPEDIGILRGSVKQLEAFNRTLKEVLKPLK